MRAAADFGADFRAHLHADRPFDRVPGVTIPSRPTVSLRGGASPDAPPRRVRSFAGEATTAIQVGRSST